jgi:hypothetical protein
MRALGTRRKRKPRQYDEGEWEQDGGGSGGPGGSHHGHHGHAGGGAGGGPPPSGTGYASQSGGPCDHCGR